MKKLIALTISLGMLLSLCSCGKTGSASDDRDVDSETVATETSNESTFESTSETTATTTSTTMSTITTTTTEKSTTEKIRTTKKTTTPTATESDFDELMKYAYWLYYSGSFDTSKLSSPEIVEKLIMPLTVGFSLYIRFYDFPKIYFGEGVYPTDPKDPMGRVDDWWCYVKLDADKVDWILMNIFDATPEHNYSLSRSYYYDGYYYINAGEGGDGGTDISIKSKELTSDGRYNITFAVTYWDGEKTTMKVVAKPKTVDGKRIWAFYSSTGAI